MIYMKKSLILFFVVAGVAFWGCASRHIANEPSQISKQILDITIDEKPDSVVLAINGNQVLTYTSEVDRKPGELYLSFPETSAEGVLGRFIPPRNDIIHHIRVGNAAEGAMPRVTVFVAFNQDSTYKVVSDRKQIRVHFSKTVDVPSIIRSRNEPSSIEPPPEPQPSRDPIAKPALPASELYQVTSRSNGSSTTIMLETDGTIKDYRTFELIKPDRIVFDFQNLKSRYRRQKTIDVQSQLVHRIRYYGHPDKLRLVVDTRNNRLLKYTTEAKDFGLIIQVDSAQESEATASSSD